MVATGKDYILDQWWIATFPGLAIFLAVMAFNLLGDGLEEALSPTLRSAKAVDNATWLAPAMTATASGAPDRLT